MTVFGAAFANNELIEIKLFFALLKAENKELKAKNKQLQDELLLDNVKSQIGGNDINKLLMISKLMDENGFTESDLKELFSKGDVKIED